MVDAVPYSGSCQHARRFPVGSPDAFVSLLPRTSKPTTGATRVRQTSPHVNEAADMAGELWIFGYGSLIWRPAFVHVARCPATLTGYERRFCQASHDHRGTPDRPGRVVTLLPVPGSDCRGMAYQLPQSDRDDILRYLDHREQDGYQRLYAPLLIEGGRSVPGLTWVAHESNPSWRAGESMEEVARLIASRHGPSGSNREYLYNLEQALEAHDMPDVHVSELSHRVRELATDE